jgi:hypothetical protein
MKIEILRSVMISGEPASAGSLLEVNDRDANFLVLLGKAKVATEKSAPAPEAKPKRTRSTTPKE